MQLYSLKFNATDANTMADIISRWIVQNQNLIADANPIKELADELLSTFSSYEWEYWKTNRAKNGKLKERLVKLRGSEVALLVEYISSIELQGMENPIMNFVISEIEKQKHIIERNRMADLSAKFQGMNVFQIQDIMKEEIKIKKV